MIYVWDSTFEAKPDNNTEGTKIDDYFRRLYIAIRERMAVDHIWGIGSTDGGHNKLSLAAQTAKPEAAAGYGYPYTKDVGDGAIELFYEDAAGNEIQITDAGAINPLIVLEPGTYSVFYQDVAPTGWTIQDTLNDKLLFVTKGSVAGGQTGGEAHSTGTWTPLTHTHTYNTVIAHTHTYTVGGQGGLPVANALQAQNQAPLVNINTSSTGSASGTTAAGSPANTWRPAAYNVIIAKKD
jgi:hypothetical protein